MVFNLPDETKEILYKINNNGYVAYLVGGCVRDMLLKRTVSDWDISTTARPEEVSKIFTPAKTDMSFSKYGTAVVSMSERTYEITTMRKDGAYSDARRPDAVAFTQDLKEDIARRDFTINALAYSEESGLIDLFGGMDDLRNSVIRSIGNPYRRLSEDNLRIMRAFRFSAQLGFTIDKETLSAMEQLSVNIRDIPLKNLREELNKAVLSEHFSFAAHKYAFVLISLIKEIKPMLYFEQHTPYHNLDVWSHTIKSLEYTPDNLNLKLCMLLHDIGKPSCFKIDANGIGHAKGHSIAGADIARKVLTELGYDKRTTEHICALIYHHDRREKATYENARKFLYSFGEDFTRELLTIRRADNMAKNPSMVRKMMKELDDFEKYVDIIIKNNDYTTKNNMAVNGNDMMLLGFKDEEIGSILNEIYSKLVNNEIKNDRKQMLEFAHKSLEANR